MGGLLWNVEFIQIIICCYVKVQHINKLVSEQFTRNSIFHSNPSVNKKLVIKLTC